MKDENVTGPASSSCSHCRRALPQQPSDASLLLLAVKVLSSNLKHFDLRRVYTNLTNCMLTDVVIENHMQRAEKGKTVSFVYHL